MSQNQESMLSRLSHPVTPIALTSYEVFYLKIIVDLQKSCKARREFSYNLHSASSNVNILHNHGIFVKTKTLILAQLNYSLDSNFKFFQKSLFCSGSNPGCYTAFRGRISLVSSSKSFSVFPGFSWACQFWRVRGRMKCLFLRSVWCFPENRLEFWGRCHRGEAPFSSHLTTSDTRTYCPY